MLRILGRIYPQNNNRPFSGPFAQNASAATTKQSHTPQSHPTPYPPQGILFAGDTFHAQCLLVFVLGKEPPADFDSLRGGAGMFCLLFCCSVLLWGRGGGFFVAFLRLVRN